MSLVPTSQIMAQVREAQADGLREAAEVAARRSDANVPKDTGALLRSRRIRVDEATMRAEVSYGEGLDDLRAVVAHEKVEDSSGPKYLERALASELPRIRGVIAAEIKKKLG